MISVIIPSMGKDPEFFGRLPRLASHPLVGEIILIDNTYTGLDIDSSIPKLIHIKEGTNTYVNPAWNKGVEMSVFHRLMILNDDVETDFGVIDLVHDYITPSYGMIGSGKSCWHPHHTDQPPNVMLTLHREMCYGSLYFIHKESYIPIPPELKIWYGDDWLFAASGNPNLQIINWKMYGESSVTAGREEFTPIQQMDTNYWRNISTHSL